jgi:hypothetical protein
MDHTGVTDAGRSGANPERARLWHHLLLVRRFWDPKPVSLGGRCGSSDKRPERARCIGAVPHAGLPVRVACGNAWASERDVDAAPARRRGGPRALGEATAGPSEAGSGSGEEGARSGLRVADGRGRAGAGRLYAVAVAEKGRRSRSWTTEWCADQRWPGSPAAVGRGQRR